MWSFFSSVFTGSNHVNQNLPCQDYANYTITEKGVYVAALSDGASSSVYGDIAASRNVNSVINLFHMVEFDDFLSYPITEQRKLILNACRSSIQANVNRIPGAKPRDFAATLLFMASDGQRLVFGHIGDGAICGATSKGEIETLSHPANIGHERNKTFFTLSQDAEEHFEITVINDISDYNAIIMMSDGPETSFYDYTKGRMRDNNLLTVIDDIGRERARETELTYFLKSNFWKHGITGDDCSILLFVRESE